MARNRISMAILKGRSVQIGSICFCRGGWRECIGINPLQWSKKTIVKPIPIEFIQWRKNG